QLKSLFKKALKEHKPQPLETLEPLTALVKAALAFDVSDDRAEDALAAIQREYCDLNELRVATDLEIQDLIGARYPAGDLRAAIRHHLPAPHRHLRARAHPQARSPQGRDKGRSPPVPAGSASHGPLRRSLHHALRFWREHHPRRPDHGHLPDREGHFRPGYLH